MTDGQTESITANTVLCIASYVDMQYKKADEQKPTKRYHTDSKRGWCV